MYNLLDPRDVMSALFEALCDSFYLSDSPFELPSNLCKDVGMYFCLELSADNHGYENDGTTYHPEWEAHAHKYYHVIVLSGRRVYILVSENAFLKDLNPKDFKNTSNHDSCWRSDGFGDLGKVLNDIFAKAYSHIPREHQPKYTTAGIYASLTPILMPIFRYVRVKRGPLPQEKSNWGYFDQLLEITPINFKIKLEG